MLLSWRLTAKHVIELAIISKTRSKLGGDGLGLIINIIVDGKIL